MNRVQSVMVSTLALVALAVLVATVQTPVVAQSPAPAGDSSGQIKELQRQVRYLYTEVASIRTELRKQSAGGSDTKKLDAKIVDLTKKLEAHTHDVLQEGRAADGSLKQVDQAEFSRAGLNSTGAYRVGKAKF